METFDFKDQLKIGQTGEELFLSNHSDITRTDGRKGDFIGVTGRLIELKTESRPSTTANMFCERYSNFANRSPGEVWQAAEHGAHYLVQLFTPDKVCLWFPVYELKTYLEENESKWRLHLIKNKGWSGGGYAVPQKDLAHLVELREVLK
jgi:hypothetical protein